MKPGTALAMEYQIPGTDVRTLVVHAWLLGAKRHLSQHFRAYDGEGPRKVLSKDNSVLFFS
eukprot:5588884-Amphidinium_carterae.2